MLLREAIGGSLRRARTARRRTLRDVSRRARVSLGYLSEVERGRKEPSSELLAAICDALDVALSDLVADAACEMARRAGAALAREAAVPRRPIGLGHTELRLAGAPSGSTRPAPVTLPVGPASRPRVRAAA